MDTKKAAFFNAAFLSYIVIIPSYDLLPDIHTNRYWNRNLRPMFRKSDFQYHKQRLY